MSALVRTLQADGVLNDVTKLYSIAQVAAQTMVLSSSLGSLDVMVSMARALRNIPNENIVFIQFPVLDAPAEYPGKVIPDPALSERILAKIQVDEPYVLADDSGGRGSEQAPIEEPAEPEVQPAPTPDEPAESTEASPGDADGTSEQPAEADSTEQPVQDDPPADETEEEPVTQAEVLEGLVGQTASDVTCAVAN